MKWQSVLAIYLLFWMFCAFLVLPFGVRTHEEAGLEKVRGQADSAPADFRLRRFFIRTTLAATLLFATFYINYVNGWLTRGMIENALPGPKING
jgi:predicted secreted protein